MSIVKLLAITDRVVGEWRPVVVVFAHPCRKLQTLRGKYFPLGVQVTTASLSTKLLKSRRRSHSRKFGKQSAGTKSRG